MGPSAGSATATPLFPWEPAVEPIHVVCSAPTMREKTLILNPPLNTPMVIILRISVRVASGETVRRETPRSPGEWAAYPR